MVSVLELLPCPFCGNTECYVEEHPESVWDFVVTCDDCGTSGPNAGWGYRSALCSTKDDARTKAIELWNNRTTLHVKFTESKEAFTAINDKVFIPLEPKIQRLT